MLNPTAALQKGETANVATLKNTQAMCEWRGLLGASGWWRVGYHVEGPASSAGSLLSPHCIAIPRSPQGTGLSGPRTPRDGLKMRLQPTALLCSASTRETATQSRYQ